MDAEPGLSALSCEWVNRAHPDMAGLLARLLALKTEKTYAEAMYDLATRRLNRHARDEEYVAHLLYLVDERSFPIVALQPIVGIQQGHLYRTLARAGVEFVAAQSSAVQVDDSLYPWAGQVHIDPLAERVKMHGRDYAFDDPACPVVVSMGEDGRSFSLSHREDAPRPAAPPPFPGRRRS